MRISDWSSDVCSSDLIASCRTYPRRCVWLGEGCCGGAGFGSRLPLTEPCLCGGIIGKDRACRAAHVRIVGLNAKRLCVRLLVRCFFQVLEIGVDLCMGQRRSLGGAERDN